MTALTSMSARVSSLVRHSAYHHRAGSRSSRAPGVCFKSGLRGRGHVLAPPSSPLKHLNSTVRIAALVSTAVQPRSSSSTHLLPQTTSANNMSGKGNGFTIDNTGACVHVVHPTLWSSRERAAHSWFRTVHRRHRWEPWHRLRI